MIPKIIPGDLVELRNPFKTRDIVNGVEIEYLIDPTSRMGIILAVSPNEYADDLFFDILLEGEIKKSLTTAFWEVKVIK